jgi:hypothetical protein
MLEEKIYKDYVDALKVKNKHRADFLSLIRAEIKNAAIVLKKDKLDDNEVMVVLKKQKKRLEDAKESFLASGRVDAIEELKLEITSIEEYLPKAIDQDELLKIITAVIAQTQAVSMKDMGKVMKEVTAQAGPAADAKIISQLVKAKLSGSAQ